MMSHERMATILDAMAAMVENLQYERDEALILLGKRELTQTKGLANAFYLKVGQKALAREMNECSS